jgi:hypothetical protein
VRDLPDRAIERSRFSFFQILAVTSVIHAERPDSTLGTSNAGTRKLFIDPSSTSVALRGKASVIVSPLAHRDGNYVGDYQLKVGPYFFKKERQFTPGGIR